MIIGIDLGTTNSRIAASTGGAARLLPLDLDHATLARHGDTSRLRALKLQAQEVLGCPVTGAVLAVPLHFTADQRNALRVAGEQAQLGTIRFLDQPFAAALACGVHEREDSATCLVFDLGGGRFDVTVLDVADGRMQVRASAKAGDLGGGAFDDCLVQHFFHATRLPQRYRNDAAVMAQLAAQAEGARWALTDGGPAAMSVHVKGAHYTVTLDQSQFQEACAPLLARLREPVERALRDARLLSDQLDTIVLAGGATRMPMVRRMVTRMLGRLPPCAHDPEHVVALGAAMHAASPA